MLENESAHESPSSGRGIVTSPAERKLKRNQVVFPYRRFTLVTIWSLRVNAPVTVYNFRSMP
jgi:hypothetical protein